MTRRWQMLYMFAAAVLTVSLLGCNWLQGDDGKRGPTGLVGPQGPQGPQGFSAADDLPLGEPYIIDVHIADGSIDGRVLESYLQGGTIHCPIGSSEIAGAQVGSTAIAPGAVTTPKFNHLESPPVVGSDQIGDGTVGGANFLDGSISAANVSPASVQSGDVAPAAVDTAQIVLGALHNMWITPPSALLSPPPAPFNDDQVSSTAGNCSAWETIDFMSVPSDTGKGGSYLAVFNAAINSDYLHPIADESAWVRLTLDGATLTVQSIPSNDETTGVDFQSISLFAVAQLDGSPHTFAAEWKVCGNADLTQRPDTHGSRGLTVIEFAQTEVWVKP